MISKIHTRLFILSTFLIYSSAWSMGIKPPTITIEYGDCNFACQEIPPDSDVLKDFGKASQKSLILDRDEGLRVAVWNIHKQKDENSLNPITALYEQSDLLMFEEVELNDLFPLAPFAQTTLATSFITTRDAPTGVANIAKGEALKSDFRRTLDLEPFVKSPKAQVLSWYTFDSRADSPVLLAVNIHGINRRDTDALERQIKQVEEAIQSHVGPVIYAGDFNTRNSSRLKMVRNWAKKMGFKEVFFTGDTRKDTDRLDLSFVRGLTVKNTKITNDPTASDHPLFQFRAYLEP